MDAVEAVAQGHRRDVEGRVSAKTEWRIGILRNEKKKVKMMKKTMMWLMAVAVLAVAAILIYGRSTVPTVAENGEVRARQGGDSGERAVDGVGKHSRGRMKAVGGGEPAGGERQEEAPSETSEEENREDIAERQIDAFDAETDRWMDAEKTKPPTMAEVEKFRSLFKSIPPERKEECLQRALNLIPDENVMLLAGILMDKTENKELVELVFNDMLNRDEDVKKPILQILFKDKSHPCWADAAWILDVTGERR